MTARWGRKVLFVEMSPAERALLDRLAVNEGVRVGRPVPIAEVVRRLIIAEAERTNVTI
jgi:hypothetical protein